MIGEFMHPPLVDFFMEKPCERCKTVTICDSDHRICYDCFVELDLAEAEEE